MNIFRSTTVLDSFKSSPAVHFIPSSGNAHAFGDTVSIGAKTAGSLSFGKIDFRLKITYYNK